MKLPNSPKAIVDERKVREYLLSPSHPVGRFNARFFESIGIPPEAWSGFVKALQRLAEEGEAQVLEDSDMGRSTLSAVKSRVRVHDRRTSNRCG
jgi:hypothetical protein